MTDAERFIEETASNIAALLMPLAAPAVLAVARLIALVVRHPEGAEVAATRAAQALEAKAEIRK